MSVDIAALAEATPITTERLDPPDGTPPLLCNDQLDGSPDTRSQGHLVSSVTIDRVWWAQLRYRLDERAAAASALAPSANFARLPPGRYLLGGSFA